MSIEELEKNGFCYCLKAWGNRMHWYSIKSLKYIYNERYFREDLLHALTVFGRMEHEGLYIYSAAPEVKRHWEDEGGEVVDAILYEYIILVTIGESPNSTDHSFEERFNEYDEKAKKNRECHFADFLYALIYLYGDVFHREQNLQCLERMVKEHDKMKSHLDLLDKNMVVASVPLSNNPEPAVYDIVMTPPPPKVLKHFKEDMAELMAFLQYCQTADNKIGERYKNLVKEGKAKARTKGFIMALCYWLNENGCSFKYDTIKDYF